MKKIKLNVNVLVFDPKSVRTISVSCAFFQLKVCGGFVDVNKFANTHNVANSSLSYYKLSVGCKAVDAFFVGSLCRYFP